MPPSRTHILRTLLVVVWALVLSSCSGVEEKRVRQVLHEKGFGSRAQGVATLENYVSGGDAVLFVVDPAILGQAGAEQLVILTAPQPVGLDGTIYVPYVGPLWVLGMTENDLSRLVSELLQRFFTFTVTVNARITAGPGGGKAYFVFGESLAKGRIPLLRGDLTVFDALATTGFTTYANLGRVHVIRPDAENPLDIVVNFREMVTTGNTTYNILLQDNDILYVPATFFGTLARFLERLLTPVGMLVNTLLGISTVQATYDYTFNNGAYPGYPYYRY